MRHLRNGAATVPAQRYPQGHDHAATALEPAPPQASAAASAAPAALFGGIDSFQLFNNSPKNKNAAAAFDAAKDKLRSLKRSFTQISWVGFYLGRDKDGYTKDMFTFLRGENYGIVPIYFGLQITTSDGTKKLDNTPNRFDLGTQMGQTAVALANAAGIPQGFCLFYDLEEPEQLAGEALKEHIKQFAHWRTLFAGWSEALAQAKYRPGIYIHAGKVKPLLDSLLVNKQITQAAAREPRVWAVKYLVVNAPGHAKTNTTPANWVMRDPHKASAGAHLWQWGGNQRIVWKDSATGQKFTHDVDLNGSLFRDPGGDP
jgi:hypothetical protein